MKIRIWLVSGIVASLLISAASATATPSLTKVRYGQSADSLVFFPLYVARDRGYFTDEGIDLDTVILSGGPALLAAQAGHSIDVQDTTLFHVATAHDENIDLAAVGSVYEQLGVDIVVSTAAYKRLNLDAAKTLGAKIQALRGLKIGISSPGSSTDLTVRSLLRDYGMDADKTVSLVPLGSGGPLLAALERGVIDAFAYPSPFPETAEIRGDGRILISTTKGEVPKWRGFQYQVLAIPRSYAAANHRVALGLLRALARAEKLTRDNPVAAKRSVRKFFPKIEDTVLNVAMDNVIRGVPATPYLTKHGYELNEPFLNAGGGKEFHLPPFDTLVTNDLADEALSQLGIHR